MRDAKTLYRFALLGMAVLSASPAAGGGRSAEAAAVPRLSGYERSAGGIESLPVAAQGLISRTLGRDDAAYHARDASGGLAFENGRHRLGARFGTDGVEVHMAEARLGLSLRACGYGEALRTVPAAVPHAEANRIEYRRGQLTEWYVNGPLGLEQGFTLAAPPARRGHGPLTLSLALTGDLMSSSGPGHDVVTFVTAAGTPSLRYRGLTAFDAAGQALPARLEVRGATLLLRVEDAGARYPLTVDPFIEKAKLVASDGTAFDSFGDGVAISGDTVVVGARGHDIGTKNAQGAAYVFVEPPGGWTGAVTETAKLVASDGAAVDFLGWSVAISGDTVVVGAAGDDTQRGSAYVFVRPPGGWMGTLTEQAKLRASVRGISDFFGASVAVSEDTVLVGAPDDDVAANANQGSAYVFVRPAGGWAGTLTEQAMLTASDGAAAAFFGRSVAVSGDTAVVGA
jgi:hypothetical protein